MSWSGPLLQQQFVFTASWINEKLHESQEHAEPWTSQRVLEPQSWIRPTQTWRAAKAFPGQCLGTPAKLSGGQEVRFYQSVVASIRWVWSRSSRGWLSCRRRRSLFACLGTRDPGLAEIAAADFLRSSQATAFLLWSSFFTTASSSPFSTLSASSFISVLFKRPCGNVPNLRGCYGHCSGQQLGQCLSSTSCSYKNTLGRQWQTMGMAVTEGIEMQQVGQDMTCNGDDKL